MIKFNSDKYARLFARDKKFVRLSTLITFGLAVFLILGGILAFTAPEGEGFFEGRRLASFIIIVAAVLISVGIWIYFLAVHNKVKALVAEAAGEYISRDSQLLPLADESGNYVFSIKEAKKFILYESGNKNRALHFSFGMFVSLYDEDTTFYNQTALALAAYFYKKAGEGALYNDIALTADYKDKKTGVSEYKIISGGVFNEKLLKKIKPLAQKLYS